MLNKLRGNKRRFKIGLKESIVKCCLRVICFHSVCVQNYFLARGIFDSFENRLSRNGQIEEKSFRVFVCGFSISKWQIYAENMKNVQLSEYDEQILQCGDATIYSSQKFSLQMFSLCFGERVCVSVSLHVWMHFDFISSTCWAISMLNKPSPIAFHRSFYFGRLIFKCHTNNKSHFCSPQTQRTSQCWIFMPFSADCMIPTTLTNFHCDISQTSTRKSIRKVAYFITFWLFFPFFNLLLVDFDKNILAICLFLGWRNGKSNGDFGKWT